MPDGTLHTDSAWSARVTILKRDDEQGLVGGWLYQSKDENGTVVVDHSGDVTDIALLEKASYRFVEESRAGTEVHERECGKCARTCPIADVRAGRCGSCKASLAGAKPSRIMSLVECVCFTAEKKRAMGIPEAFKVEGTWVMFRIDRSTAKGREAWEGVKSGKYKMLSLGGRWRRTEVTDAA